MATRWEVDGFGPRCPAHWGNKTLKGLGSSAALYDDSMHDLAVRDTVRPIPTLRLSKTAVPESHHSGVKNSFTYCP